MGGWSVSLLREEGHRRPAVNSSLSDVERERPERVRARRGLTVLLLL
jgi:hypothetical protein